MFVNPENYKLCIPRNPRLRACGVANLRWEDIDLDVGEVTVTEKGAHQRTLPLPAEVCNALETWHRAWPTARVGPVIRSYKEPSQGLTAGYISQMVARICRDAGVHLTAHDGRTGHALRHGRAGALARAGADLRVVQRVLGHQHLASAPYATVVKPIPRAGGPIGVDIALVQPGERALLMECKWSNAPGYVGRYGYHQAASYALEARAGLATDVWSFVVGPDELVTANSASDVLRATTGVVLGATSPLRLPQVIAGWLADDISTVQIS